MTNWKEALAFFYGVFCFTIYGHLIFWSEVLPTLTIKLMVVLITLPFLLAGVCGVALYVRYETEKDWLK